MPDAPWIQVCDTEEIPPDSGVTVLVEGKQIAIFNFSSRDERFACQNNCPHWNELILSRGLLGDDNGEPKITCPMHKRNYSLLDGRCLSDSSLKINIVPVLIKDGTVLINTYP